LLDFADIDRFYDFCYSRKTKEDEFYV